MNKITLIIKKNFLILIKSRWLALTVVLGPLLMIFLTGIAFDNLNEYRINIGVYSPSYTELTNSFIAKLNTDQFRTIKSKSQADCIDSVKVGLSHTCVVFPANLALGSADKEISIFIDYSKLNLAWVVRDRLFSRVEEKSTEITRELTQNILSKLFLTKNEISNDIALLDLTRSNENEVINKTDDIFRSISTINTTVGLNASDIDRLEAKIFSLKYSFDELVEKAVGNAEFAEDLVKGGYFSDNEEDNYLDDIKKQKSDIIDNKEYVESLFNPQYSGSVNNSIDTIRIRVDMINLNANATNTLVSKSKSTLYNITQLTALNTKLISKMGYSMKAVKDDLDSIEDLSAEDIASPITAGIRPLTSYNTYLNYMFPTLMAMAIMLAALLLSSIVIVMELNTPAYFRNVISPTSKIMFFFGSYLTNLSLVGFQTVLMILISVVFFFSQVMSNILTTLVLCFLIATFFIMLGMGIGYLFKTEQMSILAATFGASMFLFLSNVLLPIENMPEFFMKIVQFNPFIISVSLLRKSILFKQSLIELNEEIFILVVFIILLLALYAAVYYSLHAKKPRKKFRF